MFPRIPASLFSIVVGLSGLSTAWRSASQLWHVPTAVGEFIAAFASLCWVVLLALYSLKWIRAREEALAESRHPIQCCFIGLVGVATMLVAGGAQPHAPQVALAIFVVGLTFTIAFAAWRTGGFWQGGREVSSTTPVIYLPTVGGCFVAAIVGSTLGYDDWGRLAFGAGLFSWLALESVILHRTLTGPELPEALRPVLGLQLAPPAVGCVAYLSVTQGHPDLIAYALLGYALLQGLVLMRLLPWIWHGASAGYWAFTFGATSLATAALKLVLRGDETGALTKLAPVLFLFGNIVVLIALFATIRLTIAGRLIEKRALPSVRQP